MRKQHTNVNKEESIHNGLGGKNKYDFGIAGFIRDIDYHINNSISKVNPQH